MEDQVKTQGHWPSPGQGAGPQKKPPAGTGLSDFELQELQKGLLWFSRTACELCSGSPGKLTQWEK